MRIAIHHSTASHSFSGRWIEYCKKNNIDYKIVNAYDTSIIEQVKDCDVFMWHHYQTSYKDSLFAKQLLFSLEMAGKRVFPDWHTGWHFDDKVGQKYLLESIGAPLVPSYIFYTKKDAMSWIEGIGYPKVFKLRGGSGAFNVVKIDNKHAAKRVIRKAFGSGFPKYDRFVKLKERVYQWRHHKDSFFGVCKSFIRLIVPNPNLKMLTRDKGYVLFQDFIPNNKFDIRIVVIGDKAFGLKRLCRENDFRASGSGSIVYDYKQLDERCVRIAFDVNELIQAQSIAYDFVFDENNEPLIVEISFGYAAPAYDDCEGYWTKDMTWHQGSHFDFCGWMIETCIKNKNN